MRITEKDESLRAIQKVIDQLKAGHHPDRDLLIGGAVLAYNAIAELPVDGTITSANLGDTEYTFKVGDKLLSFIMVRP